MDIGLQDQQKLYTTSILSGVMSKRNVVPSSGTAAQQELFVLTFKDVNTLIVYFIITIEL